MKIKVRKVYWGILLASIALRWILIAQGGLFFNPDEYRYNRAILLLHHLKNGELTEAGSLFFKYADHSGFMLVGALPAAVQGILDTMGIPPEETMPVAAMLLSLFSVANLALVYAIARRTGRSQKESLLAMFLMACACTMYRYSRHLLPYDISIFFALAAILLVHGRRNFSRMVACGLCGFMVFMTYNAFWTLAALMMLYAVIEVFNACRKESAGLEWRACTCWVGGLLFGFVLLPLLQMIMGQLMGYSYLQSLTNFSETITQGTWGEGWWIGWAYLWHSEGINLCVWGLGIAWLLAQKNERSTMHWMALVLVMFALLVVGSVGIQKFVVYGRSMRQMIPFVCLLAAAGLIRHPRLLPAILMIVVLQTAWSFVSVARQHFPGDVLAKIQSDYEDLSVGLAVTGPELHVDDTLLGPSRYVLINHRVLTPVTGTNAVPDGTVIFSHSHPFQSKLYQYNGLNADERRIIDSSDQSIRLIDTRPSS